jgi:excisionase family DNA binding protein
MVAVTSLGSDVHYYFLELSLKSKTSLPFRSLEATNSAGFFILLFSQKDSARSLGISLRSLQNLIAAKQIPVRRIGRRVLIHRKDLEAFARRDHMSVPLEEKPAQGPETRGRKE